MQLRRMRKKPRHSWAREVAENGGMSRKLGGFWLLVHPSLSFLGNYNELHGDSLCDFQIVFHWFPTKQAKDHVHQFQEHRPRQSKAYWMLSRNAKMRGQGSTMSADLRISNSQMANDRLRKRIAKCSITPWRTMNLFWDCSRSFPPLFVAGQAEVAEFSWVPSCEGRVHHHDNIAKMAGVLDRVARASWKCGGQGLQQQIPGRYLMVAG